MRNQYFLFFLIALGIVSSAELFVIITTIPPESANQEILWTFFGSLFGCLTLLLTAFWQAVRLATSRRGRQPSLGISFRQAALLAALVVLSLFFKSLGILSAWDIIPLAISALLIEFFFQADKSASTHEPA